MHRDNNMLVTILRNTKVCSCSVSHIKHDPKQNQDAQNGSLIDSVQTIYFTFHTPTADWHSSHSPEWPTTTLHLKSRPKSRDNQNAVKRQIRKDNQNTVNTKNRKTAENMVTYNAPHKLLVPQQSIWLKLKILPAGHE